MKLYNRKTSYYTIITIPKCLVSLYGKKQIWRSLNTKNYTLAKLRAELETMSIRQKILNDLNKKKQDSTNPLDFDDFYDDNDDDTPKVDSIDYSHSTDDDFLKIEPLDALCNMSDQTYQKYLNIKKKHKEQQKHLQTLKKKKPIIKSAAVFMTTPKMKLRITSCVAISHLLNFPADVIIITFK